MLPGSLSQTVSKSEDERASSDLHTHEVLEAGLEEPALPPEFFLDIAEGVIQALYATRSQGAYNVAKELEEKYADLLKVEEGEGE